MLCSILKKNAWITIALAVFVLVACAEQTTVPVQTIPTATTVVAVDEPTTVLEEPTDSAEEPMDATEEPAAEVSEAEMAVSFSNDVLPILQDSCLKCHSDERTEKGFDVSSYAAVIAGSEKGPVIVFGDADASKLITLLETGKMPKKAPKWSDEDIQLIRDWINAGALDN